MKKLLIFILLSLAQLNFCSEREKGSEILKNFDPKRLTPMHRRSLELILENELGDLSHLTPQERADVENMKRKLEEYKNSDRVKICCGCFSLGFALFVGYFLAPKYR